MYNCDGASRSVMYQKIRLPKHISRMTYNRLTEYKNQHYMVTAVSCRKYSSDCALLR